jgi:integrase
MAAGSTGTWLAWVYDAAASKDITRSLGAFEDLPAHERYTAAKKAAEALAGHLGRGGTADSMTISEVCAAYIKHQRGEGKGRSIDEAAQFVARWIDGETLGKVDVRKLTAQHLRAWRQKLSNTAVVVNPHADEKDQTTRARSASTVNRQMTTLRAALNFALQGGVATSDTAWRLALKPIPNADRRRNLYLDRKQRAALIEAAPADLALFLKGLALVPLRPGTLAAIKVGDFNPKLNTLRVGKDKAGADRTIKLPPATATFFTAQCKDKLVGASLFMRANGTDWNKDDWKKPIKVAADAARLPAATTAYALRHSVITDLVTGGLDVLTVARLAGTSVLMIERHYGHLRADHAAAALASLAV